MVDALLMDEEQEDRGGVQYFLYQPPSQALLDQAKAFASNGASKLDWEQRRILNNWIELAHVQLAKAKGGFGSAIDGELEKLGTIPMPVMKVQIFCTGLGWKEAWSFPLNKKYLSLGKIKASAFGKIKKGLVVSPPGEFGRHTVTSDAIALKMSKLDLSQRGKRITGERIFEDAERELAIMTLLAKFVHPNILMLLAAGRDDAMLYTVTPLGKYSLWDKLHQTGSIEGGLGQYLTRLRQQIGSALLLLHSLGFAHRDVSLENIIEMPDESFRLIDFGLSVSLNLASIDTGEWMPIPLDQRDGQICAVGKTRYLAPEIFTPTPNSDMRLLRYDPQKADVFSFAICMFVFVFRIFPYQFVFKEAGINPNLTQLREFWSVHADRILGTYISEEVRFLERMLHRDPTLRSSTRDCI